MAKIVLEHLTRAVIYKKIKYFFNQFSSIFCKKKNSYLQTVYKGMEVAHKIVIGKYNKTL